MINWMSYGVPVWAKRSYRNQKRFETKMRKETGSIKKSVSIKKIIGERSEQSQKEVSWLHRINNVARSMFRRKVGENK